MRDRGQEGILHLVERPESFGRLPLTLLALAERLLGELAFRHVEDHALQVQRGPVLRVQERRLVVNPDRAAVGPVDPVLRGPRQARLRGERVAVAHLVAFGRIDELEPQLGVLEPLLRRHPCDLGDLRAHIEGFHRRVGPVEVDRGRHVLDDPPVPLLGLPQPGFGGPLLRDVVEHALTELRHAVLVADDDRLIADPQPSTVPALEPVLLVEGLVRGGVRPDGGDHPVAIVGVQAAPPEPTGTRPVRRGVAEHRGDLRAHVDRRGLLAELVDVGHRRERLDEEPVPALRVVQRELRRLALADVDQEAVAEPRVPVAVSDDRRLIVQPADRAVLREDA